MHQSVNVAVKCLPTGAAANWSSCPPPLAHTCCPPLQLFCPPVVQLTQLSLGVGQDLPLAALEVEHQGVHLALYCLTKYGRKSR